MKKLLAFFIPVIVVTSLVLVPAPPAAAQFQDGPLTDIYNTLDPVARVFGQEGILESEKNVQRILIVRVTQLIRIFLGFLGLIFVILIMYAGTQWMTARGNSDQVETAQGTLRTATIGLFIVLSSYAIASFILIRLLDAGRF